MSKQKYDAVHLKNLLLPGIRGAESKLCPELETNLICNHGDSELRIVAINPSTGKIMQDKVLDRESFESENDWRDEYYHKVQDFCKRAKTALT